MLTHFYMILISLTQSFKLVHLRLDKTFIRVNMTLYYFNRKMRITSINVLNRKLQDRKEIFAFEIESETYRLLFFPSGLQFYIVQKVEQLQKAVYSS